MKRSTELLEKRRLFIHSYIELNKQKQMKVVVADLIDLLFISERTIYNEMMKNEPYT